jgi:hypothetical protein
MKKLLVATLLLFAVNSIGVSRIGGGKISSQTSLFEMEVPQSFGQIEQNGNVVIAMGPLAVQPGQAVRQFLQIREFTDYYLSIAKLDRASVQAHFVASGWDIVPFASDDCVDVYAFSNTNTRGFAATWGEGKGVTVVGPNTGLVQVTQEQVLQSLKLDAGACSWK